MSEEPKTDRAVTCYMTCYTCISHMHTYQLQIYEALGVHLRAYVGHMVEVSWG